MRSTRRWFSKGPDRNAFSLIEVMLIVSIIGLLAVLMIPALVKQRMSAQNAAFVNDLRVLSAALEQYAIENGTYPPDAAPGVVPPSFRPYLPQRIDWDAGPGIGGQWDWDRSATAADKINGVQAAIAVIGPRRTTVQMTDIDAAIDDGSITSGALRQHPNTNGYMFVLQE